MAYWKTLTYRVNTTLQVRAFLLTQSLDGLVARSPLDEFTTYELSLTDLETRTGLQFADLVQQALITHVGSRYVPPRRLSGLGDIRW